MAYFQKTDSRQKVERSLATARASRDNLMERRKAAEASASELREKARQLAREGADDGALAKTESAMRAQQDRVVTLTAAIGDVERDIGEFEREVAAIVDTAMRAETSAAVTAMVERVERAESTFARAIQELEDAMRECSVVALDAHGLTAFLMSAKQQVSPANAVVIEVLKAHATAVIQGGAPASLPRAPAPAPKLTVIERPVRSVFAVKAMRYKEIDGRMIVLGANRVVDLPIGLVEKALKIGAAIEAGDKRRRELEARSQSMVLPDPRNCVALDDSELTEPRGSAAPKYVGPIMSTVFEPMDRGPAIHGVMPVQPAAAGGQRTLKPDE